MKSGLSADFNDTLAGSSLSDTNLTSKHRNFELKMFGNGTKFFDCIDLHCGGEPARIVFGIDFPRVEGVKMAQKRENIAKHHQNVADLLLQVRS